MTIETSKSFHDALKITQCWSKSNWHSAVTLSPWWHSDKTLHALLQPFLASVLHSVSLISLQKNPSAPARTGCCFLTDELSPCSHESAEFGMTAAAAFCDSSSKPIQTSLSPKRNESSEAGDQTAYWGPHPNPYHPNKPLCLCSCCFNCQEDPPFFSPPNKILPPSKFQLRSHLLHEAFPAQPKQMGLLIPMNPCRPYWSGKGNLQLSQ